MADCEVNLQYINRTVYGGYVFQGFIMLEMIVHSFEAEH
jgi:hypothetical protein